MILMLNFTIRLCPQQLKRPMSLLLQKILLRTKRMLKKNNYSKFNDEVAPVTSGSCLWPKFAYFSEQSTNFNLKKVNFQENSIIYVNQRYLKIKNNKNMIHADFYILGQIIEALNAPKDISSYVCKKREVKIIRPRYEQTTGEFLGLYKKYWLHCSQGR